MTNHSRSLEAFEAVRPQHLTLSPQDMKPMKYTALADSTFSMFIECRVLHQICCITSSHRLFMHL